MDPNGPTFFWIGCAKLKQVRKLEMGLVLVLALALVLLALALALVLVLVLVLVEEQSEPRTKLKIQPTKPVLVEVVVALSVITWCNRYDE